MKLNSNCNALVPIIYTVFTQDFHQTQVITVATFAEDNALLSSNPDPVIASNILQLAIDDVPQ